MLSLQGIEIKAPNLQKTMPLLKTVRSWILTFLVMILRYLLRPFRILSMVFFPLMMQKGHSNLGRMV